MAKFVSNKDETVRLFKNPVLEYFSHIHPATPVVTFLPVVAYMLYSASDDLGLWSIIGCYFIGLLLWTFTEYGLHRWAFHYEPKSKLGKRLHFLIHGIHHDYPRDSTRLVMPVLVSVPLATLFYFVFLALFGVYTDAIFAGFVSGYIAYDSIHYATHHFPMKSKVGRFLKEYHLRHHFVDPHTAYGVSNPLWDFVFRTTPIMKKRKSADTDKA